MKKQKGISLITVIIIVVLIIIIIASIKGNDKYDTSTDSLYTTSTDISLPQKTTYGLGDTITFDGLQLTFDTTYSFTSVNNIYSEQNGNIVIQLGVTVKNISTEKNSLNMFFYDTFGSHGTELDDITAYFSDNIDYAGDLKPGASYKTYFHILYDGNGKYSIDFDNYTEDVSVEFNVNR